MRPVGLRPVSPVSVPAAPKAAQTKPAAALPAATKPAAGTPRVIAAPSKRPPAFELASAPKEPLDEIPLTQRAELLAAWIDAHPQPTPSNVRHFLYQHAWVVTGAKFGWWHGAEALRDLIAADRAAQKRWGIGRRSELVARRALAAVEARLK